MNIKDLAIAGLIGAAASLIFVNVPILNLTNFLLCAPFWASAVFAVWIYKRLTGTLTLGQGVIIGLAAGFAAGIIGFLLSFIGLAGGAALADSYKMMLPPEAEIDIPDGSGVIFNLCGVMVNLAFGALGGLIGGLLFQAKK